MMIKKILILLILLNAINTYSQVGSYAGAFARLGFGARGMSMGNALVSDVFNNVNGYYNPALGSFQKDGYANIGYTFLSMDRRLNFFGITKKFTLQNSKSGAGISFGWINAGVGNIDGRDNDARKIGELSTFENQFLLGTSFLVDENVSLGVGFKLYYSKLYDEVKTTSVAFDLGVVFKVKPFLSIGASLRDISAKYKWETTKIYGNSGTTTENKFPTLLNFGATYKLPKELGTISIVYEGYFNPKLEIKDEFGAIVKSEKKLNHYFKLGSELKFMDNLFFRAGIDRIEPSSEDILGNLKPSFGVGFYRKFSKNIMLGIDYSFQLEPYSHDPFQCVGISVLFN